MRSKESRPSWRNGDQRGGIANGFAMTYFKRIMFRVSLKITLAVVLVSLCLPGVSSGQRAKSSKSGSHSTHSRVGMTPETRALVENAMTVVCREAKLDPLGSTAIDDMQARPSLSAQAPEARDGAERAQRLLPVAKSLAVSSLRQLIKEYGLQRNKKLNSRVRQGIARIESVKNVRPDMESRDNASVYLSRPHTITFGTLFLAGLKSDEGMISVLAHELMHIADGDQNSLNALVAAVGVKASDLTRINIRGQRSEELTCDLIGAMAARTYISKSPSYESIARRLSRAIEHNCVTMDEGDEDHLSPRSTLQVLLVLNPTLVRELINDQLSTTN